MDKSGTILKSWDMQIILKKSFFSTYIKILSPNQMKRTAREKLEKLEEKIEKINKIE